MLPIWMDSFTNGPGTNPHFYETWKITPLIRPLKQEVIGNVSEALWVVMGTIGLVMLIACANVTNLLLVRVEARQQELAVRAALGASRWRAVRGLLVESLMLGLMGGAAGVGLAYAGVRFLAAIGPANLPRLSEISIDSRTLAFAFLISALSGLFFPVAALPSALRTLALVFPTTHAVALIQGVWDGSGWSAHWVNVAALLVLFAAYTTLSTKVFRWE